MVTTRFSIALEYCGDSAARSRDLVLGNALIGIRIRGFLANRDKAPSLVQKVLLDFFPKNLS